MKDITINFKNKTIEMSKSFAKAASEYGSDQYKALIEARKDFPTFKLVTKIERKKSANSFTYDFMFKYITAHDSDGTIIADFRALRAVDESGNRIKGVEPADYRDVQEWFFNTYPDFKNRQNKIDDILNRAKGANQESNSSTVEDETTQNNNDAE